MNKEELLKEIMKLPKVETNNLINTMNSINIDDLMSAFDRLNKVPTYDELLKENQELKEKLDKYENPEDMTLMMMWCIEKVKDENKELKIELSGYRQAILNNKEMLGLKEQNEKLKKQLENKYEKVGTLTSELLYEENTKLINQQKEFIKYLEDEIKRLKENDIYQPLQKMALATHEHILQKYKEIIGENDV